MNPVRYHAHPESVKISGKLGIFDDVDHINPELMESLGTMQRVSPSYELLNFCYEMNWFGMYCEVNVSLRKRPGDPDAIAAMKQGVFRHSPLHADLVNMISNMVAYEPPMVSAYGSLCMTRVNNVTQYEPPIRLQAFCDGESVTIRDPRALGAEITTKEIPLALVAGGNELYW